MGDRMMEKRCSFCGSRIYRDDGVGGVKRHVAHGSECDRVRIANLERSLADLKDTLSSMVAALTGTTDPEVQRAMFDATGSKPSDYCRAYRRMLAHLTALCELGSGPSLDTLNKARVVLGRPELKGYGELERCERFADHIKYLEGESVA